MRDVRRLVHLTPHQFGYGWLIRDAVTGEQILDVVRLEIEASGLGVTFVRLVHVDLSLGGGASHEPSQWAEWCVATFAPPDPDAIFWRAPEIVAAGA